MMSERECGCYVNVHKNWCLCDHHQTMHELLEPLLRTKEFGDVDAMIEIVRACENFEMLGYGDYPRIHPQDGADASASDIPKLAKIPPMALEHQAQIKLNYLKVLVNSGFSSPDHMAKIDAVSGEISAVSDSWSLQAWLVKQGITGNGPPR